MTAITTDPAIQVATQAVLADRFILTKVQENTLVFPAEWVAEIVRFDRSQVLHLPFYDPLVIGVVNHNGLITPLLATAKLLEVVDNFALPERVMVVKLNQSAQQLSNIGFIVDQAISTITRTELPKSLFEAPYTDAEMVLLHLGLIPKDLWKPRTVDS